MPPAVCRVVRSCGCIPWPPGFGEDSRLQFPDRAPGSKKVKATGAGTAMGCLWLRCCCSCCCRLVVFRPRFECCRETTHRQTHRHRHTTQRSDTRQRQTDRQTGRDPQTDRETDSQSVSESVSQTETDTDTDTDTDRQTVRQSDRQRRTQRDRERLLSACEGSAVPIRGDVIYCLITRCFPNNCSLPSNLPENWGGGGGPLRPGQWTNLLRPKEEDTDK